MLKRQIIKLAGFVILALPLAQVVVTPAQAFDPAKTYKAGIEAAFPPWSYVEQGKIKGVAVDALRAVAEIEGIKLEIKDFPWSSLIPSLRAGKIDMLGSIASIKPKRDEVIDFCIPNNTAWDVVLVSEDSKLTLGEALYMNGAKVGVQAGAAQDSWATKNITGKGFKVDLVRPDDLNTLVSELGTGRVGAIIVAKTPAAKLLEKKRPVKILAKLWETRRSHAACSVQQGDPNKLLPALNRGYVKLSESGKWCEIWRQYMPKTLECGTIPAYMPSWVETYHPAPGLDQ